MTPQHGTYDCYIAGCNRPECAAAFLRRGRAARLPFGTHYASTAADNYGNVSKDYYSNPHLHADYRAIDSRKRRAKENGPSERDERKRQDREQPPAVGVLMTALAILGIAGSALAVLSGIYIGALLYMKGLYD